MLEAREVLNDGIRRIADEVRNSLDFLTMTDASAVVERVVLTGPAVVIPGFPEQLGEQVGLPLEVGVVQEGTCRRFRRYRRRPSGRRRRADARGDPVVRAVNLIPADSRGRGRSRGACDRVALPVYVLLGFLAAAVALVTLYVLANNSISSRTATLNNLKAQVAQEQAAMTRLGEFTKFARWRRPASVPSRRSPRRASTGTPRCRISRRSSRPTRRSRRSTARSCRGPAPAARAAAVRSGATSPPRPSS